MKLEWQLEDSDIIRVKEFYDEHKDSDFVTQRRKVNVERNELFWNRRHLIPHSKLKVSYRVSDRRICQ
jgi:hypothetical protein